MRRLALLACAGGLAMPAVPATANQAPADVLVLSSGSSEPVSTRFATSPDRSYTITVTGAFSYNGRAGLADCGHWDPETEASWQPTKSPLLDEVPSPCTFQPFTPTHTYSWTTTGTGRPFVFRIVDPYLPDNIGDLVVVVVQDP
jgi:hypothetical protein